MGRVKELMMEFEDLQKNLLKHKYLYYVKDRPIIGDYDYDMMENHSLIVAKLLGFRADKWEGPEENEKDHVHWMVDFDSKHPLAQSVIDEVENVKS
jgi:hypothetical protein